MKEESAAVAATAELEAREEQAATQVQVVTVILVRMPRKVAKGKTEPTANWVVTEETVEMAARVGRHLAEESLFMRAALARLQVPSLAMQLVDLVELEIMVAAVGMEESQGAEGMQEAPEQRASRSGLALARGMGETKVDQQAETVALVASEARQAMAVMAAKEDWRTAEAYSAKVR